MATDTPINVLLIEDNPTDIRLVQEILRGSPSDRFNIVSASTLAQGLERLAAGHVDVILLDLGLPDSQGFETFQAIYKHARDLPIIILTISANEELGLKAIRAGAQRFFSKDVLTPDGAYAEMFPHIIHYAIEHKRVEEELQERDERVRRLNEELEAKTEELRVINAELEQRVKERTEELHHEAEERARAEKAVKAHARSQSILTDVITVGNKASDLAAACVAMLDTALELLNLDNGGIFLRDGDTMTLQYERGYTAEQRAWTQRIPITQPRIARIMEGTPWISDDYQADATPEAREMNRDVASMATVPLTAGDAVVGFYQLVSLRRPHHFTDEERTLLVAIGREAGTVIARLQTQEALAHELAITETITRLTPPLLSPLLDFDGIVLAILDDAKRLTGSVHGFIALIDPLTKDLISHGHTQMLIGECAIPAEERQIRFPVGADGMYHALSTYAINERKGFFTNTPAEHPAATGMPDGHVPLERFLAVPALVGDEIVGEIALANSERDYTERDVLVVGRLAEEVLSLAVQRMRAEQQLHASSLYARTLIEASLDPLVTISAQGTITDVNRATEEVTGYGRDELIGSDFSEYFTEPTKADAGYRKVFADGIVRDYPLAIRHKSGSVTDVLYNATVYHNEAGEVQGVFAAARDITDRKRAEEELQRYSDHLEDLVEERTAQLAQSEEQYRTLVETANSIIIAMKTDRTITFVNDYGARFFGYAPEELVGKDVMILVPEVESTGRPLEQHVRDILSRPDEYATNLNENITKDGRRVWVQWVNRGLVDNDGRHTGHLAVGIDVTALKHAEVALKDAERLAAIGQTATMIGHDLRNPLQALQLTVDLGHTLFGSLPPEVKNGMDSVKVERLFSNVEQQIQYMDKIVSDLQDYARPLSLERERVNLATLIDETLAMFAIPEVVSVHVNVLPSITATVDRHLMQRALANLITNAVQAMPKGGDLTIDAVTDDRTVVITIQDTGEGITKGMKEILFSPLTTGKAKGTGLGLAVVKRIVEAHNGTIEFESEGGKGTTFTVTLPQTADV